MSHHLPRFMNRSLAACVIALMALLPLSVAPVYADETCTPPAAGPGVHRPIGADASLYHYDCASSLWVSSHFTYDPATGRSTPNDPVTYTYNSTTGKYDTQNWVYSAPQGSYIPVHSSVTQPPAGATVIGGPPASTGSSISNTGAGSTNTITGSGSGQSISNTGANSTNAVNAGSGSANATTNNTNDVSMNNQVIGQATTGNALTIQNTTAGDAASGNAQDVENIVNMLQSASSALGSGNVVTFVANIDGDVNGDLSFDPNALGAVQPASGQSGSNLTINNQTGASINNDIDLTVASGDATVSENTTAGDATSGSAQAVANVVNLINSAISSGQSFIGTININGNLNGDILIPPSFIEQLIATNVPTVTISLTGPDSTNTASNASSSTTKATNTNNQGITNNVAATAQSGDATVSQNTTAGNATSGQAATHITAFNLTGSNVIGNNAILVFVNVLGSWVGMIVNAPPGTTAAGLGGGISSNSNSTQPNTNTSIDNQNNAQINNNIHVAAQSGDATVTRNTTAGDATSGDAKAAVNLMNVQNSSLSLANWFGILFINVFGTWHGSFGVNTAAGDPVGAGKAATADGANGGNGPADPSHSGSTQFFRFIPHSGNNTQSGNYFTVTSLGGSTPSDGSSTPGSVLAAARTVTVKGDPRNPAVQSPEHNTFGRTAWIIGGLTALFIVSDVMYTRRHPERA